MTTAKTSEKKEKFRRVDVSRTTGAESPSAFKETDSFKELLLPLSQSEFGGFVSQVKQDGRIITPIIVDEDMVILDGHHRRRAAMMSGLTTIPYEMVKGLSQEEKIELVYSTNLNRRQLTLEQMKEVCEQRFTNYMKLYEQNPQEWSLERVASLTGKSVEVVRKSMKGEGISVPDRRTTLSQKDISEIKELVGAKKPYAEIAAQFGVSKGRISQVVSCQVKPKKATAKKAAAAGVASGPFVHTWPSGKTDQATLVDRIRFACSVGSMAVAVIPEDVIDEVENLIDPDKRDVDGNSIGETDAERWDEEADEGDREIDGDKDEDMQSIAELYGDADDEEDDA
jgi:hypothetical protein